ncbi:MAG: hypothetical protein V2A61_03270 [Calditrichota bacterium]
MTVEQAIISALDYEQKVRDHYFKAAKSTDDAKGQEIFTALGNEEQEHVVYLKSRLANWHRQGRLDTAVLDSLLPSRAWIQQGKAKMSAVAFNRSYDTEIQMMRDALILEQEVSGHYRNLVASLDGDAQLMFRRFLEIEDGHTAIVQAELDALEKNGFWFDFAEFNLEMG